MVSHAVVFFGAAVLIAVVLWDAFETIILPQRVTRGFRLARLFYRCTWIPWSKVALYLPAGKRREAFLGLFGPLSLLLLFSVWAFGLILGFALLHWGLGSQLQGVEGRAGFLTDLYLSGTTFFTLGLGDVAPATPAERAVTVIESGIGFGYLAIVVSYLPVLYGAFSRREINISMMDARAGSPPTAGELLQRHLQGGHPHKLTQYLRDWEIWSAELMESHLSYPVLCYFRSQHTNQSWLAALTTLLDSCALVMAHAEEGDLQWQAEMTFAISRHAVADLHSLLRAAPRVPEIDRLSEEELLRLRTLLSACGVRTPDNSEADQKVARLRQLYEPQVSDLSRRLLMPLPAWISASPMKNWKIEIK